MTAGECSGGISTSDMADQNTDLTNCDREPIHILGAIQPIGFLIALTSDWLIARVSANTASFIGLGPDELIGRPLADVLAKRAVHDLRNRTTMLRGPDAVERVFNIELIDGARRYDVALHFSNSNIILEAEPASGEHGDASGTVRSMITRLDQCLDLAAFLREGARQVRALVEFDRVMVYRFDYDGSGEVVAEACKPGIGRFMGLRYPASDIPVQARELYKRNQLRIITDVNAIPIPIVPILSEKGEPLDLSLSVLRSVSPIHIEYLKNMGVDASMSISIIVEGRLWGLFACHHYAPRCPTFDRRSVSELFAQMFSMRLESRERQETMEFERRARDISDQLLGAVASDDTLLKDPRLACRHPDTCHLGRRRRGLDRRKLCFFRLDAANGRLSPHRASAQRDGGRQGLRDRSYRLSDIRRRELCDGRGRAPRHSHIALAARLCRALPI